MTRSPAHQHGDEDPHQNGHEPRSRSLQPTDPDARRSRCANRPRTDVGAGRESEGMEAATGREDDDGRAWQMNVEQPIGW